jgi:plasmid replication initiation protein
MAREKGAAPRADDEADAFMRALRALPGRERKLVALAYSRARASDDERKAYSFSAGALAEALSLEGGGEAERLREACRRLFKRPLLIPREDGGFLLSPWLSAIESGARGYSFRLQGEVRELVLGLRESRPALALEAFLRLDGKYSLALLELLVMGAPAGRARGSWEVEASVAEIRERFDLDERYEKAKAMRKWVIMGAIDEINLADIGLRAEVETMLEGKKTRGFLFRVRRLGARSRGARR